MLTERFLPSQSLRLSLYDLRSHAALSAFLSQVCTDHVVGAHDTTVAATFVGVVVAVVVVVVPAAGVVAL